MKDYTLIFFLQEAELIARRSTLDNFQKGAEQKNRGGMALW